MIYPRCILMLVIFLIGPLIVAGQSAASAKLSEKDQARFDELRARGFEATYNLDYDEAQRQFEELARSFPDHPAGPQFLAANLWLKTLNKARRLSASLYNSDAFYASEEDKVDQRTLNQFRDWTRQAKALAEARLKRDPRDVEALYHLGATEGLRAAFAAAVERRFIAALREGSRSVDRHRQVIKLDPSFHDAEISIGMYDYVVGALPLPVKILASIGGVRGSKKRGLATLERVAREGRWARDDAKVLLIALLKREKRFAEALAYARELSEKYPRNYNLKLEVADALVSQAAVEKKTDPAAAIKLEREAFAIFDAMLRDNTVRQLAGSFDLVHFRYGEALMAAGQVERAAAEFAAATTAPGAEMQLVTLAQLRGAQALDLAGKRREALARYRAVLERPNVFTSRAEAERGLREPYKQAVSNE